MASEKCALKCKISRQIFTLSSKVIEYKCCCELSLLLQWTRGIFEKLQQSCNLKTIYCRGIHVHCKCFDHKNYGDWKLRGPCREKLHYPWKRAVRIAGKPRNNYKTCSVVLSVSLSNQLSGQFLFFLVGQKKIVPSQRAEYFFLSTLLNFLSIIS